MNVACYMFRQTIVAIFSLVFFETYIIWFVDPVVRVNE